MDPDIRWKQRLDSFLRALALLKEAAELPSLSKLEREGLIQRFEYTYELAWNTLKDLMEARGQTDLIGSRDVFRRAFQLGLIGSGETWMDMIRSRTLTSHTYDEATALEIEARVRSRYLGLFEQLSTRLGELRVEA